MRPLSAEARRALSANRWPGNVRELENTLHRAVLLSSGSEIGVDGILSPDGARLDQVRGTDVAAHAAIAAEQITRNLVGRTVAEVERDLILETLKHCLGNRTHAANILGISIRTLRNKLNEYAADGAPIPPPHGGEPLKGACLTPRQSKNPARAPGFWFDSKMSITLKPRSNLRFLLRLLPRGVEFDCLGHQVVAHGFQTLDKFAAFARETGASVGRFNQEFSVFGMISPSQILAGDMHRKSSSSRLFSEWSYARKLIIQ